MPGGRDDPPKLGEAIHLVIFVLWAIAIVFALHHLF
jgi:hypothetical protein